MGVYILKSVLLFGLLLGIGVSQTSWKTVETSGRYRGRSECMFTSCGATRICLLGGRGENLVDVLDTATLTWTSGTPNRLEMHHVQAVEGPDECAWLAGAWSGPYPDEVTVNDIWRYCPTTDQWSIVTSIPRPRGAGATVFYQGKLYMLSGNVGGHNPSARLVAWFDSYDPETNEWSILPDIPHRKSFFLSFLFFISIYFWFFFAYFACFFFSLSVLCVCVFM